VLRSRQLRGAEPSVAAEISGLRCERLLQPPIRSAREPGPCRTPCRSGLATTTARCRDGDGHCPGCTSAEMHPVVLGPSAKD
jgi:hypothetical protein